MPLTQQAAPSPPTTAGQQAPTAPAAAGQQAPTASSARVFASEAGILFTAVKPDKVADFEMILARVRQALAQSLDPVRRQQAASWKIFKASETGPGGSILYLFVLEPVVKGADYGVARLLAEEFPAEAQELYRLYTGALAGGQTLLNLRALPEADPLTPGAPAAPAAPAGGPDTPSAPVTPVPARPAPSGQAPQTR